MVKPSVTLPIADKLDHYFRQIDRIILSRQHPLTGLMPASTAVNSHGDYTDAWVRDNVYAIQSVWGLAIAYRKAGCDNGRAYLLEQSVVKLMRGLLVAMMRQADKVERFKRSRNPEDALHAKYDIHTGDTVVADHEWGHLQLDATGIFMLMLAQMTKSGLRIVFSVDEVNFVQNLVYYLGRAYRTADFGIWERGNKINDGRAEINASSLGIVQAALDAMRGLNLFCDDFYQQAVVHVIIDEIAQTQVMLESLLPRESISKETDAALLAVIGYPAFAVEDEALVAETRKHILEKLSGQYGCKRFLLDGHQTVLEDKNRLYYEYNELRKFEHIESEWPLFFTYLFIDAICREDYVEASSYHDKLQSLLVEKDGLLLLPELYYVPADEVEAEKQEPGSQKRLPNDNVPLIWAQSLYYLGCLLDDNLISIEDIDPLRRHARVGRKRRVEVQIALLAEDKSAKKKLSDIGCPSETVDQIKDLTVKEARELSRVFSYIGRNEKLQLSGRPIRRMRIKMTSQVYRIRNQLVAFLPHFQNQTAFYVNLDNHMLVEILSAELNYLVHYWDQPGKPLIILMVNDTMLQAGDSQAFLDFLKSAGQGKFKSVSLKLGALSTLIHNAGYEAIKEVHDYSFVEPAGVIKTEIDNLLEFDPAALKPIKQGSEKLLRPIEDSAVLAASLLKTKNLYEQVYTLEILAQRHGLEFMVELEEGSERSASVKKLIEEVYDKACELRRWGIIRAAAGLLDKYYDRLDVAVQEMVIRQKQVMVGRTHQSSFTITEILTSKEIHQKIKEYNEGDAREAQLNQELLYCLSLLIKKKPELFERIITVRIGHLLVLCVSEYANEQKLDEDQAFDAFAELSPYEIQKRLKSLLSHYQKADIEYSNLQALHYVKPDSDLVFVSFSEVDDPNKPEEVVDWLEWRKQAGIILSTPEHFYGKLWDLLGRCSGIVIGDRYNFRNRLDTQYIHGAMTRDERSFALLVDRILNEIYAPEYRYLMIEAIMSISVFVEANPGLQFNDFLVLDTILEQAKQFEWAQQNEVGALSGDQHAAAWKVFYQSPPHKVALAINMALEHLLNDRQAVLNVPPEKVTEQQGQQIQA